MRPDPDPNSVPDGNHDFDSSFKFIQIHSFFIDWQSAITPICAQSENRRRNHFLLFSTNRELIKPKIMNKCRATRLLLGTDRQAYRLVIGTDGRRDRQTNRQTFGQTNIDIQTYGHKDIRTDRKTD